MPKVRFGKKILFRSVIDLLREFSKYCLIEKIWWHGHTNKGSNKCMVEKINPQIFINRIYCT